MAETEYITLPIDLDCDIYIVAGMLRSHGIDVVIDNPVISTVYPMTLSWATPTLKVPQSLAAMALELIKEHND